MMNIQNPLDVFTLCSERAQVQGELPIALLTRLCEDLTRHEGTLHYMVSGAMDEKNHPLLNLRITGELWLNCQRCAEEMSHTIDVDNTLELVHSEADFDDEEDELAAIAAGTAGLEKIVGSKTFDLLNLLEDEIILSLPIVIAHAQCEQSLPMSSGEKTSVFDALAALKHK